MTFMEETIARSLPIWRQCADTPFVRGLHDGSLPESWLRHYLVQDSLYLTEYARLFGCAIYHAETLADIQALYPMLSFVSSIESAAREKALSAFGLTAEDAEAAALACVTRQYNAFLRGAAESRNLPVMLMAALPCTLSYSWIFRPMRESLPERPACRDFILDYADEAYAESCESICTFAERKCAPLPCSERAALQDIFDEASWFELSFWQMAGEEEA